MSNFIKLLKKKMLLNICLLSFLDLSTGVILPLQYPEKLATLDRVIFMDLDPGEVGSFVN